MQQRKPQHVLGSWMPRRRLRSDERGLRGTVPVAALNAAWYRDEKVFGCLVVASW